MTFRAATFTYLFLLLFLLLTVGSTFFPLGIGNGLLNIGFAIAKAILIALVFMHLRNSSVLVSLTAAALLLWLAILFGVTMTDFITH